MRRRGGGQPETRAGDRAVISLGRAFRFLLLMTRERYWGDVTFHFRDGKIGSVTENRSRKEDSLPDVPAGEKAAIDAEVQRYLQAG